MPSPVRGTFFGISALRGSLTPEQSAAGPLAAPGLSVGAALQAVGATAGLSAVLLASSAAFGVVKGLGAAYLIYLGLRIIMAPQVAGNDAPLTLRSHRRLFRDGVVVSVLNPKITIFFMAFLPQFADPGRGSLTGQILLLGILYSLLAFVTDSGYALLAASVRARFSNALMGGPVPRYASGAVYIGLGVGTAFTERR